MAWTYNPQELIKDTAEGRKNIVRLVVGDTDEGDPQVQDEEIAFALTSNNDKIYAAAFLVTSAIYSKYARLVNVELDEAIREDYSDLLDNYKRLRDNLKDKARFENNSIRLIATGITWTDFDIAHSDPERTRPGIEQMKWRGEQYDIPPYGYRYLT